MIYMFGDAHAFDQDLGNWDISALLDADHMFANIALSKANI